MDQRILVGIPTAEYARRADFYDHLNLMERPNGTAFTFCHGQSPAMSRNIIIGQALEIGCSHVLFIDDDIIVPRDIISRLLAHDKDIVSGLYTFRNYPHRPIMFHSVDDTGRCGLSYLSPDQNGLIRITAAGLGACLIKTEVFKTLDTDENKQNGKSQWIRLGELDRDNWCDDIGFFNRARKAGFEAYCDLTLSCGHIASMIVTPKFIDGRWMTEYNTAGEGNAMVPQVYPVMEAVNV